MAIFINGYLHPAPRHHHGLVKESILRGFLGLNYPLVCTAAIKRIYSVMRRYPGQVIVWDVIRAEVYNVPLSIGVEGHFSKCNIPYMRSAIDKLATSGLPIWLTEEDVHYGPNQATILEQVIREAHAHPSVNGIVLWSAWDSKGCYRMCLTDNNFRNFPTGDVVDKILREFFGAVIKATTDVRGFYKTSLTHGDYEVTVPDLDI
ncbi:endo-1,4-beta-xylanase 5-like [Rutidosis leptorrhynchoides]|uniref:endo-1,4-beta-xylanase 5-like n=1 Tax=Rutidosis leptorrhynchoides TaxID=125765 RepID=UPI003A9956B0